MKKLLFLLPLLFLVLSGCAIAIKTTQSIDGGVFKTDDSGDHWQQSTSIYRVNDATKNFGAVDVTALIMDPTDRQAIYAGTESDGLFYSYNGGNAWQQTLATSGKINALAVDYADRCVVYAAIGNRVYKTADCSRHWDYQLIETRDNPNNQVTALALDPNNSRIVYTGTSGKGLFVSEDAAFSWHVVNYFDDRIAKILINQKNSSIIYAVTAGKGTYKSLDKGKTWHNLFTAEKFKNNGDIFVYRDLVIDPTVDDGLLYASDYGLLRSSDGGASWQELKLLTPPKTSQIYAVGVNPKDGQEIFYAVSKTLYRSQDGGKNWITRSIPTARAPKFMLLDYQNPKILFLGVKSIVKK